MEINQEIIECPKVSQLTQKSKDSLKTISKWGAFVGVICIVVGVMNLMSALSALILSPLYGLSYLSMLILAIIAGIKLINGSSKIKRAIETESCDSMELGIANLSKFFKFIFISSILAFVSAIFAIPMCMEILKTIPVE